MRRLYHFLHGMDRCEEHFYALYGGPIEVITNEGLSYSDEDPLYWQEDISYQIDQSGRSHDDSRIFLSGSRCAAYSKTQQTKEKQH